jgi:hypothetical protein
MSAHNNLNPDQLQMFMTGKEIKAQYDPNPGDYKALDHDYTMDESGTVDGASGVPNPDKLWARKSAEAEGNGLKGVLLRDGVQDEVNVYHPTSDTGYIGNGHHRVAVMAAHGGDRLLPVLHHGSGTENRHQAVRGGYAPVERKAAPPKKPGRRVGTDTLNAINDAIGLM